MKFIHIADMHFDAPFVVLNSRTNVGEIRRIEQREALKKIINYIKENDIRYFFIAGDLYENEHIRKSTIEYINNLFAEIPETKIIISPGNHDPYINNSYYKTFNWSENVYIFSNDKKIIETEEADIYGYAFTDFYSDGIDLDEIKIRNKEKINILVIHATIDGSIENVEYNPIKMNKLQNLGFDYIALGHIHKSNYNKNLKQNIIYPGSTISMGFDELGEHGMIVGDLTKDNINLDFVTVDNKEFKEIEIDITNQTDSEQIVEKINSFNFENNNLYKVILVGNRQFEINIYNLYKLNLDERVIKIKDNTNIGVNIEELSEENNLRGLFVKEVLKEIEKGNIDKEILENALEIGLEILNK